MTSLKWNMPCHWVNGGSTNQIDSWLLVPPFIAKSSTQWKVCRCLIGYLCTPMPTSRRLHSKLLFCANLLHLKFDYPGLFEQFLINFYRFAFQNVPNKIRIWQVRWRITFTYTLCFHCFERLFILVVYICVCVYVYDIYTSLQSM